MIENIQEIKDSIDIVQVIESYLPLRKSGGNFIANCPFHSEKSPSFVVNKAKNLYHCFGCNAGGNGIDFIMQKESLDFINAIKKAANICNITINETFSENYTKKRNKILDMQERLNRLQVAQFNALMKHKKLVEYLEKRGFNKETLKKYDFGLCLEKKEIINIMTYEYALNLNLITDKGYNFFNNRLTLAIRSSYGNIVGFSGRIHDYFNFTNQSKYINSKDSILYKKSEILYNFANAKELLKKRNEIYIVEGYFDALTCNLLEIPSVALCGTALNANHLKVLNRLINEETIIYIALDSDNAGQQATIRAIKTLMQNAFIESKVARLNPQYKDINEFYMKSNIDSNKEITQSVPFSIFESLEYALKVELGNAKTINAKKEKFRFYTDYLQSCKDIFIKEYVAKILEKFNFTESKEIKESNYLLQEQSFILNQLANSREKRFLANSLLNSDDFSDKDSFLHILANHENNKDFIKYAILDYENIDNDTFYKIILRYKIFRLESKRNKTLHKKPLDSKYLYELNTQIQGYKNELEIPF